MSISTKGNNLVIQTSVKVIEELNLHTDEKSAGIAIEPNTTELMKKLTRYRSKLPKNFKFNRDDTNCR